MTWKSMIRFPVDLCRARRVLRNKPALPSALNRRPIALVMRTSAMLIDGGRHLATIAHHAIDSGSPFFLFCDSHTLAAIAHKTYGRSMLAMAGTSYVAAETQLPPDTLILSDSPFAAVHRQSVLRMQIGRDIDRSVPVMPYPMHPATLACIDAPTMGVLRHRIRRISILFAGNQKSRYGDAKIGRNFGLLNRIEVLTTVRQTFANRVVDRFTAAAQNDAIVLSDSRVDPVDPADWLSAIASADFFLCCPGSSQPTCHHLTEAMSVGTIPIIEYGDRVTPKLKDGQNAICFSGRPGLIEAIARTAAMTDEQIFAMRDRVGRFYDEHLCLTRFMLDLRDNQLNTTARRICLPFHDEDFETPVNCVAMTRAA